MSAIGAAVDVHTAIQMWGTTFVVMLFLNGIIAALVIGVMWKLYRRGTVLGRDMEALTESLVPKDEKDRPVHAKLAERALRHYDEHEELIEILKQRKKFFFPDDKRLIRHCFYNMLGTITVEEDNDEGTVHIGK